MRHSHHRQFTTLPVLGLVSIACLLASGCTKTDSVNFVLDTEGIEPLSLKIEQRRDVLNDQAETNPDIDVEAELDAFAEKYEYQTDEIKAVLALFGTPDYPMAPPGTGLDIQKLRRAAGPTGGEDISAVLDDEGNVVEPGYRLGGLFREHCVHCHGISGDGAGPTALFLDPYPRDYRQGIFKYTSTHSKEKPTVEDLRRTINEGLHGTAMQAFGIALRPDEVNALIEYVKYLAIRGEVEIFLRGDVFDNGETVFAEDGTMNAELVQRNIDLVVSLWRNVSVVQPVPPPIRWEDMTALERQESIDRGRKLFRNEGQCVKCHGPAGLGDGGQLNYDDWNKEKALETNLELRAEKWLLPLQELKARNLQLGVFRGGRRPIDIYRRVRSGITGTPMPAASILDPSKVQDDGPADAAATDADIDAAHAANEVATGQNPAQPGTEVITPQPIREEQIWDIVNYVLSLQYERGFRKEAQEIPTPNGH